MSEDKNILIIGGGISGISTALEAAETGYKVVLVEKEAYLGGRVARMNKYFPKVCPPYCGLEINFRRIKQNPLITCYTLSEVTDISGAPGDFQVSIKVLPRYVNEKCTVCGDCEKVCESTRKNDFNFGLNTSKAIYLPHEMAFPYRYVLDKEACSDEDQGKVVQACKYEAIDLNMEPQEIKVKAGAIVMATGWKPYDASRIDNLGFGKFRNVITNAMMERLASPGGPTAGKILRPGDNREVKKVAFVQCAGSRDENHMPFCSSVCCLASLKQAGYVREQNPDSRAYIFYIDVRAQGKFEDFYAKTKEDENIILKKGKVARIEEDASSGDLTVEAEDILSGNKQRETVDLVVLATGMQPQGINGTGEVVQYDENGFVLNSESVYAAGCVKRPSDVAKAIQDATGTALKAIQDVIKA
ncbi:CoB--CoM heterodisulfide reductase iron-sulfur subunit A family protein [Fibrobacterota bacterium]